MKVNKTRLKKENTDSDN